MTDPVFVPDELKDTVLIAKLKDLLDAKISPIYGWGRSYSLWPLSFGLACCVFEFFSTAAARWDFARWGLDLARASPRQADMFVISGTVTKKMVPQIVRLYDQMAEPKHVIAMGACACGGGPFKEGYSVISGVDRFLPVDVYIPGCPPPRRPSRRASWPSLRRYRRNESAGCVGIAKGRSLRSLYRCWDRT